MQSATPNRNDIPDADKWNLATLFQSDADWERSLSEIAPLSKKIVAFKGTIAASKENLLGVMRASAALDEINEAVGYYASLLTAGDAGESHFQEMQSRFMMAATASNAETSFLTPEIQTIPEATLTDWIADAAFDDYRVLLQKLMRMKAHILSEQEEKILALQGEASTTASKTFSLLTNVDMDFGTVAVDDAEKPLTQTSFSAFMENPDREVRRSAYTRFYSVFDTHKNTIAALYEGSVNQDIFEARSRGYSSAREMALFPDKVPETVYDNLVQTIRSNLSSLHRYYAVRKSLLALPELRHYDVYMPLVADVKRNTPYLDAVELLRAALSPLGSEYTDTLCGGLLSGWVDRYENKGKRSGAFSSGAYKSYPYILLNYKEEVLRDVFTLAHEGGHSMHSWYSARSNPFPQYSYTIFEAEVASTFNEQLLFEYLLKTAESDVLKMYLVSMRASDILATLYRQTMFAEFEMQTHRMVESGIPLSVDALRTTYRALLEAYFGPEIVFESESDLEGLRIPHFYNAFYVYKYATGISAALALADRVTQGGKAERDDYFVFLKSGGSRYPIESLKRAGVDMEKPDAVNAAIKRFSALVDTLEKYAGQGALGKGN
jgi:oligoendopeptidase F